MKLPSTSRRPRHATSSSPFQQFCEMMMERYGNPNRISVEIFAGEFMRFFGLPEYLCVEDITELCSSADIATETRELPGEVKGLYCGYGGDFLIVYPESMWKGLQLIALLHELREIMDRIFADANPELPSPDDLESLSESFASAVAMRKPTFMKDAMHSFFNPMLLQRKYQLSYHLILYRMIRVFDKAIPLSVSLFQNAKLLALSQSTTSWREYMDGVRRVEEADDPEAFVLTVSSQTSRFHAKECFRLYHGFVPKKNSSIVSCQHALDVLESGTHVMDHRHQLPGSAECSEIRDAELITDGFISTHAGIPANIMLVSMPECFRRKYDLKWAKPSCDSLMQNVETVGEVFDRMARDTCR